MTYRPYSLMLGTLLLACTAAFGLAGCNKTPETVVSTPAAVPEPPQVVDADVSTNVKTALLQSASLQGTEIGVVTLKGDVRLTGVLQNQAQIDDAIRIARATEGVHSIHDELTLKP